MRKGLHLGCSGWSYPDDWKRSFYSKSGSLLKQYMQIFETAEINSTFYALPTPRFVQHLSERVDESKFFTAKLSKKVTHTHKLDLRGEGGDVLKEFFSLMYPARDRIEALLIQLPPWDITNMANLETFFSKLDPSFRYAIEFRHESWLNERVWGLMEDYGIANVIVDEPRLPIDLRITADFTYIRWHGHGTRPWYNYRYSIGELQEWVPRVEEVMGQADPVLGFFNNHFHGNAPLNALQMMRMMGMINPRQEDKLERMLSHMAVSQTSLDDF
ncbi:MAG: DUF72 domain-containing protein [Candidatus Thorarchaeota archaeon]|jgi:uncharacterized protein YecE (DUF72 family)